MKTAAPLQVMNLFKSFVIFFILTSLAWIGANYIIFRDFLIGWPVLFGNVIISAVAGWWWYRRRYHATFSWDQEGFGLQWGRGAKNSRKWRDFTQVSLVHEAYGRFLVRLHEASGEHLDIPASDLKLDASDLRFEVMELVTGKSPAGADSPGKES
jgi:hypothetical protein